jgi:hypothetical protein
MPKSARIGKLPPRYKFILNPYPETRLSRCAFCDKLTHPRKFAFFILIKDWGPLIMGKTGPYCSPCELIVIHQDELEMELAISFTKLKPEAIGNDYLVVGTVDKAYWKTGLAGSTTTLEEMIGRMADFKKVYDFKYEPGGWGPIDQKKP